MCFSCSEYFGEDVDVLSSEKKCSSRVITPFSIFNLPEMPYAVSMICFKGVSGCYSYSTGNL